MATPAERIEAVETSRALRYGPLFVEPDSGCGDCTHPWGEHNPDCESCYCQQWRSA